MTKAQSGTNALTCQFTYANSQWPCINSSTLCYDCGVVLRLLYGEELSRTRNWCMSLAGAGLLSNPIRSNFFGLFFESAINRNHRTLAETRSL